MKELILRLLLTLTSKVPKPYFLLILMSLVCVLWFIYNALNMPYIMHNFLGKELDFSKADNVTGFPFYIVPNVVHMVHFTDELKPELSFIQMITLKAAHRNQKPERLILHCDCKEFHGKYWNMVKDLEGFELNRIARPTHIFKKRLSSIYHASDIARIRLMMRYGGIYIDSDSYIVNSLDKYRKYEFSIGWPPKQNLGTQILIGNKNARFLKLWYHSYKYYRPERWYYNAGELPTQTILMVKPELVHRVQRNFGVQDLTHLLYGIPSNEWKTYDVIHLLYRHRGYLAPSDTVKEFNEENIKTYGRSFGQMARLVLYGTTNVIENVTRPYQGLEDKNKNVSELGLMMPLS